MAEPRDRTPNAADPLVEAVTGALHPAMTMDGVTCPTCEHLARTAVRAVFTQLAQPEVEERIEEAVRPLLDMRYYTLTELVRAAVAAARGPNAAT